MSNKINLKITGMTCNHCVMHTKKALEAVEGVESAAVELEPGAAHVTLLCFPDRKQDFSSVLCAGVATK